MTGAPAPPPAACEMRLRFAGAGRSFEAIAVDGRLRVFAGRRSTVPGHPTFTMLAQTSNRRWSSGFRRRRLQCGSGPTYAERRCWRATACTRCPRACATVVVPQDVVAHAETGSDTGCRKPSSRASHEFEGTLSPSGYCPVKSAMLLWLLCVGTTTRCSQRAARDETLDVGRGCHGQPAQPMVIDVNLDDVRPVHDGTAALLRRSSGQRQIQERPALPARG